LFRSTAQPGTSSASPSLKTVRRSGPALSRSPRVPNPATKWTLGCHCEWMAGRTTFHRSSVDILFLATIIHALFSRPHSFLDFDSSHPKSLIPLSEVDQTSHGSDMDLFISYRFIRFCIIDLWDPVLPGKSCVDIRPSTPRRSILLLIPFFLSHVQAICLSFSKRYVHLNLGNYVTNV
jgi:hypothetical protein